MVNSIGSCPINNGSSPLPAYFYVEDISSMAELYGS
jgi:hypothetical protein